MSTEIFDEIQDDIDHCRQELAAFENNPTTQIANKVLKQAVDLEESFSGSWLGYHARVYIAGFRRPQPGESFSIEWGLSGVFQGSTGNWVEYDRDDVIDFILKRAGAENKDISDLSKLADNIERLFENTKRKLVPIFQALLDQRSDDVLSEKLEELTKLKSQHDASDYISYRQPKSNILSRDARALGTQRLETPPHIHVQAIIFSSKSTEQQLEKLCEIAEDILIYLRTKLKRSGGDPRMGNKVFIGHGRSKVWLELEKFLNGRLKLECVDYNSVSTAGISIQSRLATMLSEVAFAFIVMTAEDDHGDGRKHARENVIHEIGLFQGRLGFEKAIILLEEGCEEFSNITGIGQIRFPSNNIGAKFEEVREVLEREHMV